MPVRHIDKIFTREELQNALIKKAGQLQTCIAINDGKGNFDLTPLPLRASFPLYMAYLLTTWMMTAKKDILLGGNFFGVKPEIGRYDASYSCFLKGDGKGNFSFVPNLFTGMIVKGEVRDIVRLAGNTSSHILFVKNNDRLQLFAKKR